MAWECYHDPPELELMHETSIEGIIDWALNWLGDCSGRPDLVERIREGMPEQLAPLLSQMIQGDALWWCRTVKRGPLYGHEGVALVRNERAIIYLRILNY